jgi:hypothetical protein
VAFHAVFAKQRLYFTPEIYFPWNVRRTYAGAEGCQNHHGYDLDLRFVDHFIPSPSRSNESDVSV